MFELIRAIVFALFKKGDLIFVIDLRELARCEETHGIAALFTNFLHDDPEAFHLLFDRDLLLLKGSIKLFHEILCKSLRDVEAIHARLELVEDFLLRSVNELVVNLPGV